MAIHSSILAWRIPWTEEPGGLLSLGLHNFLEEISSLSHSFVFLYFFALITEEGFLISPWVLPGRER